MPIVGAPTYNVYKNDGAGGPVDYTTIVATTSSNTYSPAALATPSDNTFAIRAVKSSLEDLNQDVFVRIIIDSSGADITGRPSSPGLVTARPGSSGTAIITWVHNHRLGGKPTGFKIWVSSGSISYGSTPTTTTPFVDGQLVYLVAVSGLSDGVTYNVAVRATNATADDPNTTTATVVGDAVGPPTVDSFTATLTDHL